MSTPHPAPPRRIDSPLLGSHYWIVGSREDVIRLRKEGNHDVIYLMHEVAVVKKLAPSTIRAVHAVKCAIPNCNIASLVEPEPPPAPPAPAP